MATEGSRSRRWQQALLLVSVVTLLGCGGKWRHDDTDSSEKPPSGSSAVAGAPSVPPEARVACEASLEDASPGAKPIPLDCVEGIRAIAEGMYRLELASAQGDRVVLTLPFLSSGFSSASECTSAVVQLSNGKLYIADNSLVPDTTATLQLERVGDEFSGLLQGIFRESEEHSAAPGSPFIFPHVRFAKVLITRPDVACDCGAPERAGDYCSVPTCDPGCARIRCDAAASVCAGL